MIVVLGDNWPSTVISDASSTIPSMEYVQLRVAFSPATAVTFVGDRVIV